MHLATGALVNAVWDLLEWKPPEARPDSPSIRTFDLEGLRGLLEQLAEDSGQDGGD